MGLEQLDLFASFMNEPPVEKKEIFSNEKIKIKIKSKKKPEEIVAPPPIRETVVTEITEEPVVVSPAGNKRGRKSYKEIHATVDLINVPDEDVLQQKLYYSISEVAAWFNVTTSQIRFWENEFDILQPRKNRKGDRLFRVEDIKNLQLIYYLVRNRKFSLEGAKDYLKANKNKAQLQHQLVESLTKFRSFLLELKTNLTS
jgi:DNA-binding transcriptional MerR regulator